MGHCLIENCKKEIRLRAYSAGFDFSEEDICVTQEGPITVVFLRRTRNPITDENGEVIAYDYNWLLWLEFGPMIIQPRLICLCPWLVFLIFPDGNIKDGTKEGWK